MTFGGGRAYGGIDGMIRAGHSRLILEREVAMTACKCSFIRRVVI